MITPLNICIKLSFRLIEAHTLKISIGKKHNSSLDWIQQTHGKFNTLFELQAAESLTGAAANEEVEVS